MQLPNSLAEVFGWIAFTFSEIQPLLPTYAHLLAAALFPIFTGSYASLSRPPSAAKPLKKRRIRHGIEVESDDTESKMEGLSTMDAILFPVVAGCLLAGLYLIIKWLEDPALLNTILNWYFGIFSILAVSRLVSDGLDFVHSLAFPHQHVVDGILYSVEARSKRAVPLNAVGQPALPSPLPGPLSRLPLPQVLADFAWFLHTLPSRKFTFKAYIIGLADLRVKLGIHGIEGLIIGVTSMLYFNFVAKPWWLTNLAGFAFAYGTLQIMSPTTFGTGTLILVGLFFYDIYFVFFTPMMVTVATKLEIPAKLLFPRPTDGTDKRREHAMLGLGDVVLPGIIIGLALRFDLYMVYLRKQKKVKRAELEAEKKEKKKTQPADESPKSTVELLENDRQAADDTKVEQDKQEEHNTSTTESSSATTSPKQLQDPNELVTVKAPYEPPTEAWGDRFWTSQLLARITSIFFFPFAGRRLDSTPGYRPLSTLDYRPRNVFPKPYFTASLVGYVLGMITTLIAMQISDHAQPALLYLVPGVLGSLWGTALLRGEVKEMWTYSEAEDEEEKQEDQSNKTKTDEKDNNEKKTKEEKGTSAKAAEAAKTDKQKTEKAQKGDKAAGYFFDMFGGSKEDGDERDAKKPRRRVLVSFEIDAPPPFPYEGSLATYKPGSGLNGDEHPGKRLKIA